jgi:hypothetical protein
MKTLRLLSLLIVPLLIAACASTPKPPQYTAASNSFHPPAGMAGLYIYKEGSLVPATDSHRISLDGLALGIVSSSAYVYSPISPGPHMISSDGSQVSLSAQAGQNYFVRQKSNVNASGQLLQSTLIVTPASVGMPAVKEIQGSDYSE